MADVGGLVVSPMVPASLPLPLISISNAIDVVEVVVDAPAASHTGSRIWPQ